MYFRCSQCGYENGPDYRFCGMCGAPLPSSQPAAAPAPVPRPSESKPAPVSGPSFLGRADEPGRSADYLLEDEEEPHSSHWRLYLALVILIVAGVLIWARWRQYGYPWAAQPTSATAQSPAAASPAGPAVDSSGSASGSSAPSASSSATSPAAEHPAPVPEHTAEAAPIASAPPPAQATEVAEHPASAPPSPAAETPASAAGQGAEATGSAPKQDAGAAAPTSPVAPKEQPKPAPTAPAASSSAGDSLVVEGEKYLYGNGVPQDCDRAVRSLTKAAAKSNPKAQTLMGAMYATGHCAARDLPTAYRWFAKALHNDPSNVRLERDLQMVWNQMTPGERQLATRSE
jgi:hypothetical protein